MKKLILGALLLSIALFAQTDYPQSTVFARDNFGGFIANGGTYLYGSLHWRQSYVSAAQTTSSLAVTGRDVVVRISTDGASGSNDAALFLESSPATGADLTARFGRIRTYMVDVQSSTTAKYRLGLVQSFGGGTGWPGGSHDGVYIAYDTSLSDTNWMCVSVNNGTATRTSMGVAPTPGTYQKLQIFSGSGQVSCSVNDGAPTNVSTNLPDATDLVEVIWVGNTTTTSRYLNIDYYQMSYER